MNQGTVDVRMPLDLMHRIRDLTDTIPGCQLSQEIDLELWINEPHELDAASSAPAADATEPVAYDYRGHSIPRPERTVECKKCGHPVWFLAGEPECNPCTDCGEVNCRSQPEVIESPAADAAGLVVVAKRILALIDNADADYDDWCALADDLRTALASHEGEG